MNLPESRVDLVDDFGPGAVPAVHARLCACQGDDDDHPGVSHDDVDDSHGREDVLWAAEGLLDGDHVGGAADPRAAEGADAAPEVGIADRALPQREGGDAGGRDAERGDHHEQQSARPETEDEGEVGADQEQHETEREGKVAEETVDDAGCIGPEDTERVEDHRREIDEKHGGNESEDRRGAVPARACHPIQHCQKEQEGRDEAVRGGDQGLFEEFEIGGHAPSPPQWSGSDSGPE